MYCPNCGGQVDSGSKFCNHCGAKLPGFDDVPQEPEYQQEPESKSTFENQQTPATPEPVYREPQRTTYRSESVLSQRSILLSIVLSLVTCGLYQLYWLYSLDQDLNRASGDVDGPESGTVLLLSIVTCGIYMLYWYYRAGEKVFALQQRYGKESSGSNGILYLILGLVGLGFVSMALIQNELNNMF